MCQSVAGMCFCVKVLNEISYALEEGPRVCVCFPSRQSWAMLEYRQGNISKARTLFDAATFARKNYAAAWHAWAQMEESVGNLEKVFWKMESACMYVCACFLLSFLNYNYHHHHHHHHHHRVLFLKNLIPFLLESFFLKKQM